MHYILLATENCLIISAISILKFLQLMKLKKTQEDLQKNKLLG